MLNARQAYTSSGQKKRLKNINIENADLKEQNKKLEQENQQLKSKLEASEKARKEAIKFMKDCEFDKTDKYIAIGEYQEYKDLLKILDIDKGE